MWSYYFPGACTSSMKNHVLMWLCIDTDNSFRLPSPVNASLAMEVIWLRYRNLHRQHGIIKWLTNHSIVNYSWVSPPSPANVSLAIDVSWLSPRDLREQYVRTHAVMWLCIIAYNSVRLPSSVNAPLSIDVTRLRCRYLFKLFVRAARDMIRQCSIQLSKASKSSKCASSNWCDQVVAQRPAQAVCEKSVMCWYVVTYNWVRLPSPVNAPLAIDVIRLSCRNLHE